jgi:hypothetical protein
MRAERAGGGAPPPAPKLRGFAFGLRVGMLVGARGLHPRMGRDRTDTAAWRIGRRAGTPSISAPSVRPWARPSTPSRWSRTMLFQVSWFSRFALAAATVSPATSATIRTSTSLVAQERRTGRRRRCHQSRHVDRRSCAPTASTAALPAHRAFRPSPAPTLDQHDAVAASSRRSEQRQGQIAVAAIAAGRRSRASGSRCREPSSTARRVHVERGLAAAGLDALPAPRRCALVCCSTFTLHSGEPAMAWATMRRSATSGCAGQRGADGGMTMEIDIGLASAGDFGTHRLGAGIDRLARVETLRFLRGDIALEDIDLAAFADMDIDAPALALRGLAILP